MTEQTFVVVGASLAGAKAAEGMRDAGFEGRIVLVGDEHDQPYERPELSKGFLKGKKEAADLLVHEPGWYDEHRVELRLGTAVAGIHRDEHEVELAGGERLGYDRLLLATGATPRRIEVPGADLDGVHYLRRAGDAATLRQAFVGGGGRLVVVGGGWIGLEVAAAARGHGVEVTVVEPQPTPLYAVLGREVGQVFADLHRANGVELRLGAGVASFAGEGGKVTAVTTDGGDALEADLVVVGVGSAPTSRWPRRPGSTSTTVSSLTRCSRPRTRDVFAAGDVANAEHPLYGTRVRVEHWANALNQGKAAGRNMAGAGEPYVRVPYFYTDQYDLSMEYYGYTGREGHDRVVFRGEPVGGGEWLAFWLRRRPGPGRDERQRLGPVRRAEEADAGPDRGRSRRAGRPVRGPRRPRRVGRMSIRTEIVAVDVVRPLQRAILRPHLPPEAATYAEDLEPSTVHLAAYDAEGQVAGVATFFPQPYPGPFVEAGPAPDVAATAWRLRGMATDPARRGEGFGAAVLRPGDGRGGDAWRPVALVQRQDSRRAVLRRTRAADGRC